MPNKPSNNKFHSQIVNLLQSTKNKVVRSVNQTMVFTYFEIDRMIVEEEQDGKERADYGKKILKDLSKVLTKEFGKGFSVTNLKQMRSFYLLYQKGQTLSDEFGKNKPQTVSAESIPETLPRESENKTIGIVLFSDKNQSVVEYTLPENNEQIFASKYQTILPSKEELKLLINEKK